MVIVRTVGRHESLRAQVRERLRSIGKSQSALAIELGVSPKRLRALLAGSCLETTTYERLCEALGWAKRRRRQHRSRPQSSGKPRRVGLLGLHNALTEKADDETTEVWARESPATDSGVFTRSKFRTPASLFRL